MTSNQLTIQHQVIQGVHHALSQRHAVANEAN